LRKPGNNRKKVKKPVFYSWNSTKIKNKKPKIKNKRPKTKNNKNQSFWTILTESALSIKKNVYFVKLDDIFMP